MANGMDWFRWHHGTVTDQKFPLVARRAGASVAEVIAVWACLLETASMNEDMRGTLSNEPDFEAMDCALGLVDGKARAIFAAMQQRALVDEHLQVSSWHKRQPKRERHDDNSTERSRAFRKRQRHATPETTDATPCNATPHTETPRGEESREEKNTSSLRSEGGARKAPPALPCPDDVDEQVWKDWLKLRKAKRAPVTQTVLDGARVEADKAGVSLEAFLRVWCRRGSQGLEAAWLRPDERQCGPPVKSFRERDAEAARADFDRLTGRAPRREVIDITPQTLELPNA